MRRFIISCELAIGVAMGVMTTAPAVRAAEDASTNKAGLFQSADPASKPAAAPDRGGKAKGKQKAAATEAATKLREELKGLTPEERAKRLKEIRERQKEANAVGSEGEARARMRARIEARVGELRKKKSNGTISADETRQLERGEQIMKRAAGRPERGNRPPEVDPLPVPQVGPEKKAD